MEKNIFPDLIFLKLPNYIFFSFFPCYYYYFYLSYKFHYHRVYFFMIAKNLDFFF